MNLHKSGLTVAIDNTIAIMNNQNAIFEIAKNINNGQIVTLEDIYPLIDHSVFSAAHKKQLADLVGVTPMQLQNKFNEIKAKLQVSTVLGDYPNNEYEFVDLLLKSWKTTVTFNEIYTIRTPYDVSDVIFTEEEVQQLDQKQQNYIKACDPKTFAFDTMREKVFKERSVFGFKFTDTQIEQSISIWTKKRLHILRAEIVESVTYDSSVVEEANKQWNLLASTITHANKTESKVALQHFLWQIKRKMFGLSVVNHLMIVFNGEQGCGKSTLVQQLCAPVKELTASATINDITDNRSHNIWKNSVLVFDEIGYSTPENITLIKQRITGSEWSSRLMFSNKDTTVTNNTTMIGTTNKDISRLIFDDTGMRRFFQIDVCNFDFNITNNINFLLLWKSIDENGKSPLHADLLMAEKIADLQEEKVMSTMLEEFFLDREYKDGDEFITASQLYNEYHMFELANNPRAETSLVKFGRDIIDIPRKIKGLTVEKLPRTRNGIKYRINKK